jgi:hypothetical protein
MAVRIAFTPHSQLQTSFAGYFPNFREVLCEKRWLRQGPRKEQSSAKPCIGCANCLKKQTPRRKQNQVMSTMSAIGLQIPSFQSAQQRVAFIVPRRTYLRPLTPTELKRCLIKGRWRPISPMLPRVRLPASAFRVRASCRIPGSIPSDQCASAHCEFSKAQPR